jgi:hypothetical protein
MIPVDAQKKSPAAAPVSAPRPRRSRSASSIPCGVQTLEILLFARTPRMEAFSRRDLPMRTGAPGNRFRVKTAPKSGVGRSNRMSERLIFSGCADSRSRGLNAISCTAQRKPSGRTALPARTPRYSDSEL